jgi:hypothetical protein
MHMIELKNGIRIMIDQISWYSLRYDETKNRYLLQFGYAGGDKTFVSYTDKAEAELALADVDDAILKWMRG